MMILGRAQEIDLNYQAVNPSLFSCPFPAGEHGEQDSKLQSVQTLDSSMALPSYTACCFYLDLSHCPERVIVLYSHWTQRLGLAADQAREERVTFSTQKTFVVKRTQVAAQKFVMGITSASLILLWRNI